MDRLNYFNPYQSKTGEHEDQLTRAYLVLLKLSGHAFFTFVEFCRSRHKTSGNEEPISIIDFLEQGWEIETQKGNPEINTKYDSFHQCKRNKELVIRRIENLLKAISSDENLVKCHHGRSLSYYIQTPYREIERICLGSNVEGNEIGLALCFGDSQRQASAFYKSNPSISHLQNTKWILQCKP